MDTAYCQSHFDSVHGQKDVTLDKLKDRMAAIAGGLQTREEQAPPSDDETAAEKKPKRNWLFADEEDQENDTFITNNFQHKMK